MTVPGQQRGHSGGCAQAFFGLALLVAPNITMIMAQHCTHIGASIQISSDSCSVHILLLWGNSGRWKGYKFCQRFTICT